MKIIQSELAVEKIPVKKVRFWQETFRGRPVDRSRIVTVHEERPCSYKFQDMIVVHPVLYEQLRRSQEIFEAKQGPFTIPATFPTFKPLPAFQPVPSRINRLYEVNLAIESDIWRNFFDPSIVT